MTLPHAMSSALRVPRSLLDRARLALQRAYWRRTHRQWRATHPKHHFGHFYVREIARHLDSYRSHETLSVEFLNPARARAGAMHVLDTLRRFGLRSDAQVIEIGCGALRIGEVIMPALEPGKYLGLDLTDRFWQNGLMRLGGDFTARHQPVLSLLHDDLSHLKLVHDPQFVISIAVIIHVPPDELDFFVRTVRSLCSNHTVVVIDTRVGERTELIHARTWCHSADSIRAAFARHGFEAVVESEIVADGVPERLSMFRVRQDQALNDMRSKLR